MSARGARSRKVQQKDIEKKEKKTIRTGKSPVSPSAEQDAFAAWRVSPAGETPMHALTRSLTTSSNNSRATSHSGSAREGTSRLKLNTVSSSGSSDIRNSHVGSSGGGATSTSDVNSSRGDTKAKFQTNTKETKAPRGRGGGVPPKKSNTTIPSKHGYQEEYQDTVILPSQRTWNNFRVWNGQNGETRPYKGFAHDMDMQDGSVLIFFKEEQQDQYRPTPSIRAHLDVLQNSGSTWIENALAYGQIDDDDADDWVIPHDAEPLNFSRAFSPNFEQSGPRRMLGPTSLGGHSPPPFDIDQASAGASSRAASRLEQTAMNNRMGRTHSPPPFRGSDRRNPTHEIWFTAPSTLRTLQEQRLHHVAIRNFFAILHGKPIVGADLFETLVTLHASIQVMYDLDGGSQSNSTARDRSIQIITNYLSQHGLDDARHGVKHILCLLAWSEQDNTRWRQGYLESFVHTVGLMSPQVEEMAEFKRLSIITRRNLSLAGKTLRLHVMETEEKLASFDFKEIWGDTVKIAGSPIYQGFEACRDFLVAHYTRMHGSWPPTTQKSWLNRKVVHTLQDDFGALYDYIVDRDVFWNPREERASRKWEMAHRKNDAFKADLPELNITDMLVTFDAKHGYSHIPHPYPLLPREVAKAEKEKEKKSFFSSLKKDKTKDVTRDAKAHLQLSIVFSDATNIEKMDVNFDDSTLIDKFEQFELTTDLKSMSPREARLGRWLLLYGILQVLSTLSVDVQGLKDTEGVRHFLCSELKRMPEWVTAGHTEHLEARQERSWCWQRAWDPTPIQTAPVELEASTISFQDNKHAFHFQQQTLPNSHSFPSPPPDRQLPVPPSSSNSSSPLDGATLVHQDIHRLREKIENFSFQQQSYLSTNTHPDQTLADHKLPIQGLSTNTSPHPRHHHHHHLNPNKPPRTDSLPLHHHPQQHPQQHNDTTYRLTESDFRHHHQQQQHHQQHHHQQQQHRPPRSQITSINTDLGAYPFSPAEAREMQWPVPPGYSESTMLGYGERERDRMRDASVGARRNADGDGDGDGEVDDLRSPRRTHERRVWE